MTRQKDLKRIIRARMQKTGESYTTARTVVAARKKKSSPVSEYAAAQKDWATLAGISDEKVKAATGCTWVKWVAALDYAAAHALSHADIVKLIKKKWPKVNSWWSQMVTVGYERIRGLREVGQGRDGIYDANKSKTFSVGIDEVYAMFAPRKIKAWLPMGIARHRGGKPNKTINLDWSDGTKAMFTFMAKGPNKCLVAVQHAKLTSKADVASTKAFWTERFEALKIALA